MNQSNFAPMLADPEPAEHENISLRSGDRSGFHHDLQRTMPEGQAGYQRESMFHSDLIPIVSDMPDAVIVVRYKRWLIDSSTRRHVLAGTDVDMASWHDLLFQSATGELRGDREFGLAMPLEPVVEPDRFRIRERLESFKDMEDGWADGMQRMDKWGNGYGKAPATEGLDWLADQLEDHYNNELPRPYLYPTPEGGVQIEWRIKTFGVELEIDLSTHQGEWFCTDRQSDDLDDFTERILDLDDDGSWPWIVLNLRRLMEHTP